MSKPSGAPAVRADLRPAPLAEVSVYVHIPFCSSRCNYCDFYFETTRSPRVIGATLERTLDEAAYFMEAMGHPRIRSLYFGGGTPSVAPPELLDRFLERLLSTLRLPNPPGSDGREIEITFEANPESTTAELLEVLLRRGVNRLSLGVQSFDDRSLRALTRRADHASVVGALERIGRIRETRPAFRLNVDLITGIPGQTRRMVRGDVAAAMGYGVDHFSVYSLTVEEHTPLSQALEEGVRKMPSPASQDDLWLTAQEAIQERGFEWYEISNFARPGFRSEHNLGYWRLDPYLGLGPGAVSTVPMLPVSGSAAFPAPVRLTNPNLFVYGSRYDPGWHHAAERLPAGSLLFEHFITGLRTSEGVSLGRIGRIFDVDLARRWTDGLERWRREGILAGDRLDSAEARLVLTRPGRLALDRHLVEVKGWIEELGEMPSPRWPDRSAQA